MAVHPHKKVLQEIWKSCKRMYKKHTLPWITTILSFVFLAITFFLPIWRILPIAKETPFIPLHYNIYLGVDRFGPALRVFWIPVIGLFFFLLNHFLQAHLYRQQKLFSFFFAVATPLFEFILLVAMVLIVLINV